jgi:hypothetical protein
MSEYDNDAWLKDFEPAMQEKGLLLAVHQEQTENNKAYLREVSSLLEKIHEIVVELKAIEKPLLRERDILENRIAQMEIGEDEEEDDEAGGSAVREPSNPKSPSPSHAAEVEPERELVEVR